MQAPRLNAIDLAQTHFINFPCSFLLVMTVFSALFLSSQPFINRGKSINNRYAVAIIVWILPYVCHHNPFLIRNCSWISTIHEDRIFWKNLLENKEMVLYKWVPNINILHIMAHVWYINFKVFLIANLNNYNNNILFLFDAMVQFWLQLPFPSLLYCSWQPNTLCIVPYYNIEN